MRKIIEYTLVSADSGSAIGSGHHAAAAPTSFAVASRSRRACRHRMDRGEHRVVRRGAGQRDP